MIVEKENKDFQIRELSYQKDARNLRLRWRFKEAESFLLFLYHSIQGFTLEKIVEELSAEGIKDEEMMEDMGRVRSVRQDGSLKMMYVDEKDFVACDKWIGLSMDELKKGIPYGVKVFACRYAGEEKRIHIFDSLREENTCFLPVTVRTEISYKNKPFTKEKYCTLRIGKIDEYREGAILYHIDGVESDFPLPQTCVGKELTIVIPRQSEVSIRIREEDKKYYKKG